MANDVPAREGIARRLSTLVRIPTVSAEHDEYAEAFEQLPDVLREQYPLMHEHLELRRVADTGLLYLWRGETSSEPLVLMAHWDVVPAPKDWQDSGWQSDPFAGTVDDSRVSGRGTLDDKGPLVVLLDAVENLLAAGFTPAHDVYVALGGDEEVMGASAKAMSDLVREELQGTEPYLVLDEGGAVTDAPLSFVEGRCGMIGLAEKGVLTVRLTARGSGGHASAPAGGAPIARIASAIRRLERSPLQPRLTPAVSAMLAAFAPKSRPSLRPLIGAAAKGSRATAELLAALGGEAAALVRTTVAPTRLAAGDADNVVAPAASVTLNCRIMPQSSVAATIRALQRRMRDKEIEIEVVEGHEPSPISPVDDRFDTISAALAASWPDATPVPYLMMAASDSRHYHSWCSHVYRFAPLLMNAEQRAAIHGDNEWVSIDSLERGERFHVALLVSRGGSWTDLS